MHLVFNIKSHSNQTILSQITIKNDVNKTFQTCLKFLMMMLQLDNFRQLLKMIWIHQLIRGEAWNQTVIVPKVLHMSQTQLVLSTLQTRKQEDIKRMPKSKDLILVKVANQMVRVVLNQESKEVDQV